MSGLMKLVVVGGSLEFLTGVFLVGVKSHDGRSMVSVQSLYFAKLESSFKYDLRLAIFLHIAD